MPATLSATVIGNLVQVSGPAGVLVVGFNRTELCGSAVGYLRSDRLVINRVELRLDGHFDPVTFAASGQSDLEGLQLEIRRRTPRGPRWDESVSAPTYDRARRLALEAIRLALDVAEVEELADLGARRSAADRLRDACRGRLAGTLPSEITTKILAFVEEAAELETCRRIASGGPIERVGADVVLEELRAALEDAARVCADPAHAYELHSHDAGSILVRGDSVDQVVGWWHLGHPDDVVSWVRAPSGERTVLERY